MRLGQGTKVGRHADGTCCVTTEELPEGYEPIDAIAVDVGPIRRNAMLTATIVVPLSKLHIEGLTEAERESDCYVSNDISEREPWQRWKRLPGPAPQPDCY